MKRLIILTAATVALAIAGCTIKPVKPIIPLGCRDLAPVCQCDSRGQNCRWTWVCVPR